MAAKEPTEGGRPLARNHFTPEALASTNAPQDCEKKVGFQDELYTDYPGARGQSAQLYGYSYTPSQTAGDKDWETVKLGLHAMSVVLGATALGLGLSVIPGWAGPLFALATSPVAGACILFSTAEFVSRWVFKREAGFHSGAHVGISLLIWLGAALAGGMELVTLMTIDNEDYFDSNGHTCRNPDTGLRERCPEWLDIWWEGRKMIGAGACAATWLLCLVHFILFVGASVDVAKRNRKFSMHFFA